MSECSQCGKPPVVTVNKLPLCVGCYALLQQTETARLEATNDHLRLLSAQMNHALDEMDMVMGGFGLSRNRKVQIPPKPAPQYNTIHSVNVASGSTVGAINTGEARNIAVAIGTTEKQGNTELAEALKAFTNALTTAPVAEDQKREMAEQLGVLAEELTKPKEVRRRAVIGPMLEGLGTAVKVSTGLMDLWSKLHPLLAHALQ